MAAYALGDRIWVIERRARVIWMREGKRGAKGRVAYEEAKSEDDARARMDAIAGERVAEGFVLVDAARSVDAPLHGKRDATAKKKPVTKGLDVAELHAILKSSTCETIDAWLARFAEITTKTCAWRLLRLSCALAADGAEFELEAVFGKGSGPNPDAYEEDGYRVYVITDTLPRDDLEDRVDLDVFADELGRISQTKMVALFRRAVEDLAPFAVVRNARVTSVEVERIA